MVYPYKESRSTTGPSKNHSKLLYVYCFSVIFHSHLQLDHFSIKTYGDMRYHHFRNLPYGGWLRNLASVDRWFISLFIDFHLSFWWQGGAGFFPLFTTGGAPTSSS